MQVWQDRQASQAGDVVVAQVQGGQRDQVTQTLAVGMRLYFTWLV